MKARVSKNLKGTLSLSSISTQALQRNQEIDLDLEQYWKADVQQAIRKRYLIITKGEPRAIPEVEIVKLTNGSVTLPELRKGEPSKVLRDNTPYKLRAEYLERSDFQKMIKAGLIEVVGKAKKMSFNGPEATERTVARDLTAAQQRGDAIVWDARAAADSEHAQTEKTEKAAKSMKKPKSLPTKKISDSVIIDPDAADADDPSEKGIQWVDVEENERRIKAHPILSKKRKLDLNG